MSLSGQVLNKVSPLPLVVSRLSVLSSSLFCINWVSRHAPQIGLPTMECKPLLQART